MAKPTPKAKRKNTYDWKKLFVELLVVFLGVTAGFLLNNWRQDNQDQKLEKKYLHGFLEDVKADIPILQEAIKADSLWLQRTKPQLFAIQRANMSVDSANSLIKRIVSLSKLEPQTGTYEDITNSGNLNLIQNYTVKKEIVDYHLAIKSAGFLDDYFYRYFNDFVMPFIFTHFNVLDGKLNNPTIINSPQFVNVIAGYFSLVQQRKATYEDVLKKSNSLKMTLERNL